ncbi:MAG: hypothetical protein AAB339_06165, partial [Elusimicrobiota bacterium]
MEPAFKGFAFIMRFVDGEHVILELIDVFIAALDIPPTPFIDELTDEQVSFFIHPVFPITKRLKHLFVS